MVSQVDICFVTRIVYIGRVEALLGHRVLFFYSPIFFSFFKEIVGIGRKLGIDRLFVSSSRSDDDGPLAGGRVESKRPNGQRCVLILEGSDANNIIEA